MDEDTARRAAKWWSNFLKSGSKLDQGDSSMSGLVAKGLGSSLQRKIMNTYTPEKIQMFEDALTEGLIKSSSYTRTIVLGVDYHPDNSPPPIYPILFHPFSFSRAAQHLGQ